MSINSSNGSKKWDLSYKTKYVSSFFKPNSEATTSASPFKGIKGSLFEWNYTINPQFYFIFSHYQGLL